LSIIRAEVDVALADPTSSEGEQRLALAVQSAADRADGLIESLLALARSDSTMHDRQTVDLAELTGDVVGERVELADQAGVEIELDLGSADVQGDRWLLERLIANLVDNGINHNVRNGWLHVAIDAQNGTTRLEVSNSGKVLTREQADELRLPFRRLAADKGELQPSGFGLGMTIAQSVAEAHEGSIDIDPRNEGGLDVVVTLPTARLAHTN
jgi:signal transduction histidine kinase